MILSVTGHRPSHKTLPDTDRVLTQLRTLAKRQFQFHDPDKVLTGMAKGWDTAVALACRDMCIPFVACVPFPNQDEFWSPYDQKRYQKLLTQAADVVFTSTELFPRGSNQLTPLYLARNRYLVDNSDMLLALYDGRPAGGTHYTVTYAQEQGKPVEQLWKQWKKWRTP